MTAKMKILDLSTYYKETAKLADLEIYKKKAIEEAGEGNGIILTGTVPVWLYLVISHAGQSKKISLYLTRYRRR